MYITLHLYINISRVNFLIFSELVISYMTISSMHVRPLELNMLTPKGEKKGASIEVMIHDSDEVT